MSETTEFRRLTDEIQLHISNGNRDKAIALGENFAKLCNFNRTENAELGKRIFNEASEYFDKMIDETEFEEV